MHERATAAGIRVVLATEVTLPVGDGWWDGVLATIRELRGKQDYRVMVNGHIKEVNVWVRQYAAQHRLTLVDLEKAVDSGNGTRREEYTQEDGSHINPAGYAAITRYVADQLD
jgi:lysophospholipase L1-like esterase